MRRALACVPMLLLASAIPALPAASAVMATPARKRGRTSIDVRSKGALGNGSNDDTLAFQRAIDALPPSGGTVHVPPGTYVIDPTRNVRLRSRMHLQLARGATLVAKPNAADRAYVVMAYKVSDVEISGGRIIGDRDGHLGTTGEWGHGIMVRGSTRVTVRDIRISKCWGDGMSVGGVPETHEPSQDVVIARVVCTGNRRQGLTIGGSRRIRVYDSEFSHSSGTAPASGIDIEPDAGGMARDIHIENCIAQNNRGCGIQIYKRASAVTIKDCTVVNNGSYGLLATGGVDGVFDSNVIQGNRLAGVALQKGARNYRITRNRFRNNSTRYGKRSTVDALLRKKSPKRHLEIAKDTQAIDAVGNYFDQ